MQNNNRPRVLFVAPLPPPVHGSSMVSKQIKESLLINDAFQCDYVNNSISRSMNEIGKFPLSKIGRYLESYFRMLWLLLRHRYDLVYLAITVNGVGFLKDGPFVITARLLGRYHVIHQHNKGMADIADRKPYSWIFKACYKHAKVILLSWNLYEDVSKIVKKDQVMVCPNGIKPVAVSSSKFQFLTSDVPELLYLSNLIESKGVWVVLDACKILKEKGYRFHCSFVGGVSKQIDANLFQLAVHERNLEDMVEYVGPKYGDEKEIYWQKADVFVFPTFYYNECFPLVVLEAMQHKVAVISSNEGGISDIITNGKTGFIVDAQILRQNSCNEMLGSNATNAEREKSRLYNEKRGRQTADFLEQLIADREFCRQMGEAGYEKYMRELTDEVFEKRMVECLTACMAQSKEKIKTI